MVWPTSMLAARTVGLTLLHKLYVSVCVCVRFPKKHDFPPILCHVSVAHEDVVNRGDGKCHLRCGPPKLAVKCSHSYLTDEESPGEERKLLCRGN